MKNTNKSFLINSSVAFILAGMLTITLHEMAHFITALLLGDNAKIFPPYVQTSNGISLHSHIIVASAGPIFSLISGLLIIRLLSNKGQGFMRLFWTWLGFLSAQTGFGYFLIAPLAKAGDTGFVLSSLKSPWPIYAFVCAVGAIGTYLFLPRLFSNKVSPYSTDKKGYFQLGMYPWLIGTAIMLAIYFVISGVIMHENFSLFLSLAGVATIGIFTPMARFKPVKDKFQTLELATPIVPIFITLIFALFLIFGLTHGI